MKRTLFGAFLGMFALAGAAILPNFVSAQDQNVPPVDTAQGQAADGSYGGAAGGGDYGEWGNPNADTNLVSGANGQKLTGAAFLDTLRNAINWILGILATIALIICLYGGFKMVTSAGDEKKYGDGLKVLKYAAIGLAIIGLSWMIVSVIFWFVGNLGGGKQTQSQDVGGVANTQGGADAGSLRGDSSNSMQTY